MTKQVEVGLVRNFQGRSLSILISVSVKMAKFLVLTNAGPGNSMSQSFTWRKSEFCSSRKRRRRMRRLSDQETLLRPKMNSESDENSGDSKYDLSLTAAKSEKNIRLLVYVHCWVSINLIHCLVGFIAVFGFLWGWFFLTLTNPSSDVVMIWPDWLARSIPVIQPKIVINMNKHLFIRNEFNSRNRDLLSTKQPEVALPNLT